MTTRPMKREGLEVHEVTDGYVVYEESSDRVHYLNHTAALVLELCTGANDVDQVAEAIGVAFDLAEPPREEVQQCIEQFLEEGLVR
jgi:hypothetical protein